MARTKRLIGVAAFGLWLSWVADGPAGVVEALRLALGLAWVFVLLAAAFVEAYGLGAAVVVGVPAAALTLALDAALDRATVLAKGTVRRMRRRSGCPRAGRLAVLLAAVCVSAGGFGDASATPLVSAAPPGCRLERWKTPDRGLRCAKVVCEGSAGFLRVWRGGREGPEPGCVYVGPHPFGRRGFDRAGLVRVEIDGRPLAGVLAACRPGDAAGILEALGGAKRLSFRVGPSHAGEVPLGGGARAVSGFLGR